MAKEVLVVEDDRALARSLIRAIEKLGFPCRHAMDGVAALGEVGKQVPDFIVMDLLLPKKDGHAVLQTLRASETTNKIPVLAISGVYRGSSTERDLRSSGAVGFLEKPFSMKDLSKHLIKHLGKPEPEDDATTTGVIKLDLARQCGAELIWMAMADGYSGALKFVDGRKEKQLLLQHGEPRSVRSNLAKEALGRRLLATGHLDDRAFQESVRRSRQSGKRQGEILIELGALTQPELAAALGAQAEDKLLELFTWERGLTWRKPGVRQVSAASDLKRWTSRLVVLRGTQRMTPPHVARSLERHASCETFRTDLELDENERSPPIAALLAAHENGATVDSLLDPHGAALLALWLIGAIRFTGEGATAAPTRIGSVTALEAEIQDLRAKIGRVSYFEILGVPETAGSAEVRRAFVSLAKTLHPDKVAQKRPDLRALAAEVFAGVSQAHEVLANDEERKKYKSGARTEADREAVANILSAEQHFQKAEILLRGKKYDEALATVELAIDLEGNEGEFHALRGWIVFRQDPSARVTAQEALAKAQTLAPNSPTAYYYLGQIAKACEEPEAAEKMFRKALEVRPGHVEALREVRLIDMRRNKGGGDSGGRGLFGRKKK